MILSRNNILTVDQNRAPSSSFRAHLIYDLYYADLRITTRRRAKLFRERQLSVAHEDRFLAAANFSSLRY